MNTKTSAKALATGLAIAAALTLPAGFAQAQELVIQDNRPARFFIGAGLTAGGDRLVTARDFHGHDESLRAGGVFQFHGGVEFRVAPAVSMALSIGYHVDAIDSFWDSTWFARWPVEALAHVQVDPHWRIGGGARYAISPRLSSDRFGPDLDEDFRATIGAVIEVEYLFNHQLGLKLRGVTERYKSEIGLPTVSGDHIGLVLNFYF